MNIILFDAADIKDSKGIIASNSRVCNHILNVLHLGLGDEFKSGIWGESRGVARIEDVSRQGISISYSAQMAEAQGLGLYIMLSYIRPICAKRVTRFVGEAGVSGLVFFPTDLGEKSYMESSFYAKGEYMEALRQGAEISGGAFKPDALLAKSADEAMAYLDAKRVVARHILEKKDGAQKLFKPEKGACAVAIGGERGWTSREIKAFEDSGFTIRSLGSRILRSEESAIACVFPWL